MGKLQAGRTKTRWTFNTEFIPSVQRVPELIMLGNDELRRAEPLYEHEHPGCYEFVFVERGKASWELGGRRFETHAGDLFHSRPGERHSGGFNAIEPCKFWWLIVEAPQRPDWLGLPPEDIALIREAMERMPRVKQVGLFPVQSFQQLKEALTSDHDLRSLAVRTALLDTLLAFIQAGARADTIALDLLQHYDGLIARMEREPEWRPSVDELAASSGVSGSHFYRTFQAYTGEAPMTFAERLRVKEACRQLTETADAVTEITHRLGYASSQHFATVFKRFVGCTPTEWRKTAAQRDNVSGGETSEPSRAGR